MKKFYYLIFIGLLTLSCNKMETLEKIDDGSMTFNVEYPATKATETAFEAGDTFGVYITEYDGDTPLALQLGGNYKSNIPVSYNGATWTADPVIYWDENYYDVFAYYPYGQPSSVDEMEFSVALDQTTEETETNLSGYEASDFLYASAKKVSSADGDVDLLFKHKMSKFTVKLVKGDDFEGEIPSEITIYIHNTATDCLIDLSSGDVIKDPYSSVNSIKMKKEGDEQFTAIVVPQMLTNKKPLVEVIFEDVSYMIESKFHFKTGTHHVVNITLSSNPEKVKIEIGGEIENGWES